MIKTLSHWFVSVLAGLLTGFALMNLLMLPATAAKTQYGFGECDQSSQMRENRASVQILRWDQQAEYFHKPTIRENFQNLKAGIAYVDNNTGAIVMKLNDAAYQNRATANGIAFREMTNVPVVVAYYDPITAVGRIWIDRTIDMGDGRMMVEQLPFGPPDGTLMADWYWESGKIGTNPFWIFEQGKNGNPTGLNQYAFVNINPAAFETAVGIVMRKFHAIEGWIAMLVITHQTETASSGNLLYKTTTTTVKYYAHPDWVLALPSGMAPGGYTTGYKLPLCDTVGDPLTSSSAYKAKQKAELWTVPLTMGRPTSVQYKGQTWGGIKVMAGTEFLNEGQNPVNLPTQQWQIYQHSQSQSGFTLVTMAIFAIALGALTGGLAAAALLEMSATYGATAATLTTLGLSGTIGGAVIGAAAGAASTLLTDTGGFGIWGSPDFGPRTTGGLSGVASGSGNTQSATNPTIVSFDMNGYLNDLYSSTVGVGTSSQPDASNPTQPSGGWSGVVGAETNAVANGSNTANDYPGSLGQQANDMTSASQSGENAPSAPDSYTKQYTNGSVSSPYGALPPAP